MDPGIDDETDIDVGGDCNELNDCTVEEPVLGYVALCGHPEHQPAWIGITQNDLGLAEADVTIHLSEFPSHQPFAVSSVSAEEIILCWQMQDMENISRTEITEFTINLPR